MPDIENEKSEEKLLILPLGEESKKITKVITNDTARQIVELLAGESLTASDIAERLQAPLTTITYNLDNLEKVGLIKVERIKYSEKGREVKVYAPVKKLIVVVPEKIDRTSVVDMLRKYMGIFVAAVFASGFVEFFMKSKSMGTDMVAFSSDIPEHEELAVSKVTSADEIVNDTGPEIFRGIAPESVEEAAEAIPPTNVTPAEIVSYVKDSAPQDIPSGISDTIISHPGLVFFLGCLFIILVLLILEYRKNR